MTAPRFPTLARVASAAKISPCGTYRYTLTRRWGDGPTCVFVMLNPSTADAERDDPTIRRCIGFAKREGSGSLLVVNLFAYRATSPKDMRAAADPVGPENDAHILEAITSGRPAIAAWGAHGSFMGRDMHFRRLTDIPIMCLGTTKAGAPRHPLYVPSVQPLVEWAA